MGGFETVREVHVSDLHMKHTPPTCVKTQVGKWLAPACPGPNTHAHLIGRPCGIENLG